MSDTITISPLRQRMIDGHRLGFALLLCGAVRHKLR